MNSLLILCAVAIVLRDIQTGSAADIARTLRPLPFRVREDVLRIVAEISAETDLAEPWDLVSGRPLDLSPDEVADRAMRANDLRLALEREQLALN